MCGKVILTLAFIATVSIQLADSLKCLTCYDFYTCSNSAYIQCDSKSANATRDVLDHFYDGVRYLNSKDFSCFTGRYGSNNITTVDLRGCIMTGTVDCFSYFKDQAQTERECKVCKKDFCNSVAAISSCLGTTITLVVLAKLFSM